MFIITFIVETFLRIMYEQKPKIFKFIQVLSWKRKVTLIIKPKLIIVQQEQQGLNLFRSSNPNNLKIYLIIFGILAWNIYMHTHFTKMNIKWFFQIA